MKNFFLTRCTTIRCQSKAIKFVCAVLRGGHSEYDVRNFLFSEVDWISILENRVRPVWERDSEFKINMKVAICSIIHSPPLLTENTACSPPLAVPYSVASVSPRKCNRTLATVRARVRNGAPADSSLSPEHPNRHTVDC